MTEPETTPPPDKLGAQTVKVRRSDAFLFLPSLRRCRGGWSANHALQRSRPSHRGRNSRAPVGRIAGSLHPMITYFAYGSNMLTERIKDRAKDANPLGIAYVTARRLTFHKIGTRKDGSTNGKCDICIDPDPKSIVYGVLFEIPKPQFDKLDTYEKGYSSVELVVHSPLLGLVTAVAHVAGSTKATLIPYGAWIDQ